MRREPTEGVLLELGTRALHLGALGLDLVEALLLPLLNARLGLGDVDQRANVDQALLLAQLRTLLVELLLLSFDAIVSVVQLLETLREVSNVRRSTGEESNAPP